MPGLIDSQYFSIGFGRLANFYWSHRFAGWDKRYSGLFRFRGFARALLSTKRNYSDLATAQAQLHAARVPTSIIWGMHDSVLPLGEVRDIVASRLPDARLFEFKASGRPPHM